MISTAETRLVGGRGPHEGRVEVFYNGRWGSVCDEGWSISDAEVVCRELGYSGVVAAACCGRFGLGNGTIWLADVKCTGIERNIRTCSHSGWGGHTCSLGRDVGVVCQGECCEVCGNVVGW